VQRKSCPFSDPCGGGLATRDWCFSSFFWHSRTQGVRSSRQRLSRRSVRWGSAGPALQGGCGGCTMCRKAPALVWVCSGASSSNRWVLVVALLWGFPVRLPHSPCCSLLHSGTEALDFPFLAFLPVAEGVKWCLGHFPCSAATRASAESCSVGGQQVLWGVICSPCCSLPGSVPSRVQVRGAGAGLHPRGWGACCASVFSVLAC